MTLAVLIQAVKDTGGAPFDWSGIWQVAVAVVTGVVALLSLKKSSKGERVAQTLDTRKFEAEEKERALENAIDECDRCRETLASEREEGAAATAAAAAKLREAEEKLNQALRDANDAWVLVGTYRERERVWLIERADLLAQIARKGQP